MFKSNFIIRGALVLAAVASTAGRTESCNPPETVTHVDLQRYLGTWYEIASYPQPFQTGCTATTATYTLRSDGDIGVRNTCRLGSFSGEPNVAEAVAKVVDAESNAKLKVFFTPDVGGDYWIIRLDEAEGSAPYQWAVVSDPLRSGLYILSRSPQMAESRLRDLLDDLASDGFDLSRLQFTPQPEMNTIVNVAEEAGQFTTLSDALVRTGLDETLRGPGPFTVFAPTDDAFAALGIDLARIDDATLSNILLYHVLPSALRAQEVVERSSLSPLNGSSIDVAVGDAGVFLNGNVAIEAADIEAENGIVHVIDNVLIP